MPRGYWLQQALEADGPANSVSLSSKVTADVCIVGGGYLGLWTAIRLKEDSPNLKVVLVERDVCGSGASGRNGGFVTSWWGKYLSLRAICGVEEANRLAKASDDTVRYIGQFCGEHGIDAEYRADGWLWTATSRKQIGTWNVLIDELARYDVAPFVPIGSEEVARKGGTGENLAGVFEPNAATLQPAKLARGLRRHAIALGVDVYENSPMTRLGRTTTPVVWCPCGHVEAGVVVLAMNAWGAQFSELRRTVVVVASDVIATAPAPDKLADIGFDDGVAICDSRMFLNYYRNTPDGRIVFGKALGHFVFAGQVKDNYEGPSPRAAAVEQSFRDLYPVLVDVPVVTSWTGPIDRSVNGLPFFGHLGEHPKIVYGIGFSGQGVGPTVIGGRILASMTQQLDDAWSSCGLVRESVEKFPLEPFRYIGSLLVRAALARKERLEDLDRKPDWPTLALANLAPAGFVPSKRR